MNFAKTFEHRQANTPESVVKDNDVEFRVSNADERASVIAYLKSLSK